MTKLDEVGDSIRFMLDIIADKVYNSKEGRQEVFLTGHGIP